MDKDKDDKEKIKENDMLSTRNDSEEPNDPDVKLDAPEDDQSEDQTEPDETDDPIIVAFRKRIEKLEEWAEVFREDVKAKDSSMIQMAAVVSKLNQKAKKGDTSNLAGAIKAMAGLALSPDGFATFKQMVPYLFEE